MAEPTNEEDDAYLYGESASEEITESTTATADDVADPTAAPSSAQPADSVDTPTENDGAGQAAAESANEDDPGDTRGRKRSAEGADGEQGSSEEKDGEDSEEDEDSDDDGVMVTIGDIKGQSGAAGFGPKRAGAPPPDKKGKFSTEDFDGTGQINGVPAQDFNLDALEDKPWRKPGADITDYFNYGFTEDTWRAYSERQKRLRYEANLVLHGHQGPHGGPLGSGPPNIIFPKKFGMQPRKDMPMNMMGMGMSPMGMGVRRDHSENTIQVMTAERREYSRKHFEMGPPPMMGPPFDMGMPPPFPPRGGEFMGPPPEFFNHPPPHDDYYDEGPEYEEQQWMDSQWEMEGEGARPGPGPSALVVPLTMKVPEVPPPPGDVPDDGTAAEGMNVDSTS